MKMHTPSHPEVKSDAPLVYNFVGRWRNQHGSELNIEQVQNGKIRGTFKTGVGAHEPDEEYELTGFVSGPLITFSVNFGKFNSLTSWTGQHARPNGEDKIETMWHLARILPEKSEKDCLWAGIWTGADTFERSEKGAERLLERIERPTLYPSYPFAI